jgi:Protein of unknown function (DUF2934)
MNNENPTRLRGTPAARTPSPDEISERAYSIWEEAGSPADASGDHWLQAEQELASDGGDTSESDSTTPSSASGSSSVSGQGAGRG